MGCTVTFHEAITTFTGSSGKHFMSSQTQQGMYILTFAKPPPQALTSCLQTRSVDFEVWHRRLGHVGDSGLKKLAGSGILNGLDITSTNIHGFCEDCIYGKHTH